MLAVRGLVVVTVAVFAAGCGGADIEALCQAREDCLGGNDKDVEACIALEGLSEDRADELGCSSEYEEVTTCRVEKATCEEIQTGAPCMNDTDCRNSGFVRCASGQCLDRDYITKDPKACEAESNAYGKCL